MAPRSGALSQLWMYGVLLLSLAGCSQGGSREASAGDGHRNLALVPAATIQELMATQVDPSADPLWASVSTVITAAGTEEKQPRTEAEWQTVRRYAVTLVEGANLLTVPGRRVAASAGKTEDSTTPGIERPENIQKAIEADPGSFAGAAVVLRDAGVKALAAIDRHSAQGLVEAGGELDSACESCHLKYWYPHSPRPR
jgi:hypothetical protein